MRSAFFRSLTVLSFSFNSVSTYAEEASPPAGTAKYEHGALFGFSPGIDSLAASVSYSTQLWDKHFMDYQLTGVADEGHAEILSAKLKSFWFYRFYTGAGLGYRFYDLERDIAENCIGCPDLHETGMDIGLDLSAGMLWNPGRLQIGFEAVKYYVPLVTVHRHVNIYENGLSDDDIEDVKKASRRVPHSFFLPAFVIGYAF